MPKEILKVCLANGCVYAQPETSPETSYCAAGLSEDEVEMVFSSGKGCDLAAVQTERPGIVQQGIMYRTRGFKPAGERVTIDKDLAEIDQFQAIIHPSETKFEGEDEYPLDR